MLISLKPGERQAKVCVEGKAQLSVKVAADLDSCRTNAENQAYPTGLMDTPSTRIRLMKRLSLVAFSMILASTVGASAAEPIGEWLVEGGYGQVRIEQCGNQLWGIVSWERTAGVDRNNPDATKRDRPTLGLPVLRGMTANGPNRWDGEIYNTQDGRIYTSHISLSSADVLRVEGCVLGFLCGGQDWTRVKSEDAAPARAGAAAGSRADKRTHNAARPSRPGAMAQNEAPKSLSTIPSKEVCTMALGAGGSTYSGDGAQNTGQRPRR
jgi:uncharacterized protein (DUF2147 family)